MSRQIKFRVWNTYQKKFYAQNEVAFKGDGTLLFYDWHEDSVKSWNHDCWNSLNGGLFTIQQFTGLLDSEGKEIYEGDLIEMPNTLIYQVCFGEWEHTDLLYTKLHGWHLNHQGWTWELSNQGKIIGNIFENSELLSLCSKN